VRIPKRRKEGSTISENKIVRNSRSRCNRLVVRANGYEGAVQTLWENRLPGKAGGEKERHPRVLRQGSVVPISSNGLSKGNGRTARRDKKYLRK